VQETAESATGKAKAKTWIGAVNTKTGEVAVTCSGAGYCAEFNILIGTDWTYDEVQFTRAIQRQDDPEGGPGKTLQIKPPCPICVETFPPETFGPGTLFEPEGLWR
jgi:hypothetical protein